MNNKQDIIDYNRWHQVMHEGGATSNPLSFAWHRAANRHVGSWGDGKLLEIGCGRGEFARYLARSFPSLDVTAVDFSENAVELARNSVKEEMHSATFQVGDATALPFGDETFDFLVSCECMEHVPNPEAMAAEMRRVLRVGGRYCLTTENYFNGMILSWLKAWLGGVPFDSGSGVQPHENFFTFWRVARMLRKAGLSVEETESCHYQWLLLPKTDPAKLCTEQFQSNWARQLAKPFGRHFTFVGRRM